MRSIYVSLHLWYGSLPTRLLFLDSAVVVASNLISRTRSFHAAVGIKYEKPPQNVNDRNNIINARRQPVGVREVLEIAGWFLFRTVK